MAEETQIINTVDNFTIIQKQIPFKCKLSSKKYEEIQLHALPTNYGMLMMDIDYPDKAKDNPNGSLFMQPSKEILQDTASDIGQLYFGGKLDWYGIYNFNPEKNIKESLLELYGNNDMVRYLLEATANDIDGEQPGEEINQETAKRKSQNTAKSFDGSPITAIDNYIAASIPVIEQLVRTVAGSDISGLKEIYKKIHHYNQLNADTINKYLEKNNEILKLFDESRIEKVTKAQKTQQFIYQKIIEIQKLLSVKYLTCSNTKQFDDFISIIHKEKDPTDYWDENKKNFYRLFKDRNGKVLDSDKSLDNVYNKYLESEHVTNDSIIISKYYNSLNEEDEEYTYNNEALKKLEAFDFDSTYDLVKHDLQQIISQAIISKPEEWPIVQNAKTRMEKLKEACDKEINAKIEIICRTVQNGSSSIGEKFKAAISKHPMRAEGLKRIWANYSDDLSDRIESRIRSISGNNGNSNMFVPIKQFLTVTYPALIAMMVTWKCAFMLQKAYTNKFPIGKLILSKEAIADTEIVNAISRLQTFISAEPDNTSKPEIKPDWDQQDYTPESVQFNKI